MSLQAGTRLGSYEIQSQLGAGGMGEVYRARDTRLDRDVALKVLPEELFEDRDRVARFEREAKALAALNHPGIAAVYSFETVSGRHILVMEIVEGEGLDARIAAGALTVEESLSFARQMAEALEAAHEKGIIHRDLKPANVRVTPEGRVKLLDFGLAKIFEGDVASGSAPSVTHSPTLTARATAAGMILGTAAYMSPEQARGKPLDKRTDIWAFGCVLFEMLTGKRVFEGETVSDTLAAVLMREPDWAALPAGTSAAVRKILKRCLQRDVRLRLHDIADARLELEEAQAMPLDSAGAGSGLTSGFTAPGEGNRDATLASGFRGGTSPARTLGSRLLPWSLAALFAAATAVLVFRGRHEKPPSPVRGQLLLSEGVELMDGVGSAVVASPDGSLLAYVTRRPQKRLFLRPLDRLQAAEVPESDGAESPFFSPDGKWIAFFSGGKLRKASVSGGAPATICEAPTPRGGAWLASDQIVLAPRSSGGLIVVSAAGGEPKALTKADIAARERSHRWPVALPDGKTVLFMTQFSGVDYNDGVIEAVNVATGKRTVVHKGGTYPRWAPSGHLLFARKGTVYAAAFDPGRLALSGQPVPILENVLSSTGGEAPSDGSAQVDVAASGLCLYRTGEPETLFNLTLLDRSGMLSTTVNPPRGFSWTRFSPDGTRVAVGISGPSQGDVWIYDIARDSLSKFTFDGDNVGPTWTPDGQEIAYASDRDRKLVASQSGRPTTLRGIYAKRADGSGAARLLFKMAGNLAPTGFSPDGNTLAFQVTGTETQVDVGVIQLNRTGVATEPKLLVASPVNDSGGVFSPDGRWLAYEVSEGGIGHVFLRSAAGGDGIWQVSDQVASNPRWSRDGTLHYLRRDGSVMATRVSERGGAPVFGKEERLFALPTYETGGRMAAVQGWDVSPDGQRFVALKREGAANTPDIDHVFVVTDFSEELRHLAPVGGK